jgi:hypothetical protein
LANKIFKGNKKAFQKMLCGALAVTLAATVAVPKLTNRTDLNVSADALTDETAADTTEEATETDTAETETTAAADSTTAAADTAEVNESFVPEGVEAEIIETVENDEIYGHKKIAESDTHELYFKEDTLSILVRDKSTGAIMESTVRDGLNDGANNATWTGYMESGIVFTYMVGQNDKNQADLVNQQPEKNITYTDNGFSAEVFYSALGLGYTLTVSLDGSQVIAEIPDDSIREEVDGTYFGEISVYPMLGYTYLGSRDGYMLIPDGNGALINLDDKEGRFNGGFSSMIYGDDSGIRDSSVVSLLWDEYETVTDSERVMAPIFGMVHTDSQMAVLGIVEDGEERASIEGVPNGVSINYNRIFAKFIKRKIYTQPTSNGSSGSIEQAETARTKTNIKIRYCFTGGDEASYAGLATAYRNYLLDSGEIVQRDNSYNTRIDFLGTDREDFLIFKKEVVMTTVGDIEEIYDDLTQNNVSSIFTLYKGWQDGGIYNLPVTSYSASKQIDGTSALTDLITSSAEKGIQMYLYQDALRINPYDNNTTFNVMKRVDKRVFEEDTYKDVFETFQYILPTQSGKNVNSLAKSMSKKGLTNMALTGTTYNLSSYTYSGKYYTRVDSKKAYDSQMETLSESMTLALEQPSAYQWKYMSAFVDMPTGTSSYVYEDEEVPFLSMTLRGVVPMYSDYVNFEANKEEFFLNLVDMGIYPSFYITKEDSSKLIYTNSNDIYSSKYDVYRDTIISYDEQLKQVNEEIGDGYIVNREYLDDKNEVVKVTYDNGKAVYVNYSEDNVTVDGVSLDGLSYKVGEA